MLWLELNQCGVLNAGQGLQLAVGDILGTFEIRLADQNHDRHGLKAHISGCRDYTHTHTQP